VRCRPDGILRGTDNHAKFDVVSLKGLRVKKGQIKGGGTVLDYTGRPAIPGVFIAGDEAIGALRAVYLPCRSRLFSGDDRDRKLIFQINCRRVISRTRESP